MDLATLLYENKKLLKRVLVVKTEVDEFRKEFNEFTADMKRPVPPLARLSNAFVKNQLSRKAFLDDPEIMQSSICLIVRPMRLTLG